MNEFLMQLKVISRMQLVLVIFCFTSVLQLFLVQKITLELQPEKLAQFFQIKTIVRYLQCSSGHKMGVLEYNLY